LEKRAGLFGAAALRQRLAEEKTCARQIEMAVGELAQQTVDAGMQQALSLGALAGRPQSRPEVDAGQGEVRRVCVAFLLEDLDGLSPELRGTHRLTPAARDVAERIESATEKDSSAAQLAKDVH